MITVQLEANVSTEPCTRCERLLFAQRALFEDPTETLGCVKDTEISCTQSDAVTLARTHPCQRLVALHFDPTRSRFSYDDGVLQPQPHGCIYKSLLIMDLDPSAFAVVSFSILESSHCQGT